MPLETLPRSEQIALLTIGLGLGFGFIPSPRGYVAEYFARLLGDAGGFVAGVLALAITGAIAGLLLHAVFKWIDPHKSRGERTVSEVRNGGSSAHHLSGNER